MNSKKQKLILQYLVSSNDLFALCSGIINPRFFDPELRPAIKYIMKYYLEYSAVPDTEQIEAETDIVLNKKEITHDKFQSCCKDVETFCKQSAMKAAVLAAPALIESEDYGTLEATIKDAVTISLNKDMGIDFFEEARATLERLLNGKANISTGWKDVDDVLFGGLQRGQLILFSAGSGGGKSITMQNLGLNLVEQGLNVLYLSLELSEELLAERMAYLLSGVGKQQMKEKFEDMMFKISEFSAGRKLGKMRFKQMPSGIDAGHIKAYLKEYELLYGHLPDAIILDYMDLMSPMDKVSADNVFEKDKRVAEELRNIAIEYNLISITASQLNRSAVNADQINHSHIAGGISKINTSDTYITIILSETLKAAGEIAFHYQKTRNSDGVGKTTYLKWDKTCLRIGDKDENKSSIIAPIAQAVAKRGKSRLSSMFDDEDEA